MSGETNYNILQHTWLWTETSGVAGYNVQSLSHAELDALSKGNATVVVVSGNRIGFASNFANNYVCNEARIYAEQGADYVRFVYATYSGEQWNMDGAYNDSELYATPAMTYYTDPSPFLVRFSSEYMQNPIYKAYEAFNQTNANNSDCWISNTTPTISVPQSIGIYVGNKIINKYRIQARNDSSNIGNPRDWTIQGSVEDEPFYMIEGDGSQNNDTAYTTPDMTSNTAPSPFIASDSENTQANQAYRAFDREDTDWRSDGTPTPSSPKSLAFDFGSGAGVIINKYRLKGGIGWLGSERSFPRDFKLQGSNNSSAAASDSEYANGWTDLDIRNDIDDPGRLTWSPYFTFFNATPYRKYRLRITERNYPADGGVYYHTGTAELHFVAAQESESVWVTLDTREDQGTLGQSAWSGWYTFTNNVAYKWYKIRITETNQGKAWVAIGNLHLVENTGYVAERLFSEYPMDMTWSGGYYSYIFDTPTDVYLAKYFLGNNSLPSLTVSGIELLTDISLTTISGVSASIAPVRSFSFVDTSAPTYTIIDVLNDKFDGRIQPHFLMQLTGTYEIDRNIFLSVDYATLPSDRKNAATWTSCLDNGFTVPEAIPWNRGVLTNLIEEARELKLDPEVVSGNWTSPVIDFEGYPAAAYMYVSGNIDQDQSLGAKLYVRAEETEPPNVNFMISTTETTHRAMMYDHKRIYFNSAGVPLGTTECTDEGGDYKIWRDAQVSWADQYLKYFGSINEKGTAALLLPGVTTCADMDYEQERSDYSKWYSLSKCSLTDDSKWDVGTTVSGFPYGPYHTVAFTKTFPIEGSDAFFVTAITSKYYPYTYPIVTVNLGLQDGDETRIADPVITVEGTYLHGDDYYDIVYDHANSAWWVYLGGKIAQVYKMDVGSINKVKFFRSRVVADGSGGTTLEEDNYYEGYTNKYTFNNETRRLIEIPNKNFSGFWALTDNDIRLYEETTEYESNIIQRCDLQYGIYSEFEDLWCGSCDNYGNLWAADITKELVVRVNLDRVLTGHSQPIDYENTVSGVVGLYAHPTNGSCYLLVTDEPYHRGSDAIRMTHYGQQTGNITKFICQVPGFCSKDYKKGISFTGRAYSDYILPHSEDTIWGDSGTAEWKEYPATGRLTHRGRYKQFKVELTRTDVEKTSPILKRFRAPKSIKMEHIDRDDSRQLTIKTYFDRVKTPGTYNMDLLIWWCDEEYYG